MIWFLLYVVLGIAITLFCAGRDSKQDLAVACATLLVLFLWPLVLLILFPYSEVRVRSARRRRIEHNRGVNERAADHLMAHDPDAWWAAHDLQIVAGRYPAPRPGSRWR